MRLARSTRQLLVMAMLTLATCDKHGTEQATAVSGEVDSKTSIPSPPRPLDSSERRKLIECGAALRGLPRPISSADLPAPCRGLQLDANDLESLNPPPVPSAAPTPLDVPRSATPRSDIEEITIFAGTGCRTRIGADAEDFDVTDDPSRAKFFSRIKSALHAESRVSILADKDTKHGCVMRVIDLLKQAGVHKIAFGVAKADPEPNP